MLPEPLESLFQEMRNTLRKIEALIMEQIDLIHE